MFAGVARAALFLCVYGTVFPCPIFACYMRSRQTGYFQCAPKLESDILTVDMIDDAGNIHGSWASGGSLSLIIGGRPVQAGALMDKITLAAAG